MHVEGILEARNQISTSRILHCVQLQNAVQECVTALQYMVDWDDAAELRPVDKALVHGNTFKKWAWEHSAELKAAVAKGDV